APGIETTDQQQRPEKVGQRERHEIDADLLRRDVEEAPEHHRIGKEDRVVEERLRGHEDQSQRRAARVATKKTYAEIDKANRLRARGEPQPAGCFARDRAAANV